jgi:hypothetical protein
MGEGRGNAKAAGGGPIAQPLGSKGEDLVPSDARARPAHGLARTPVGTMPNPMCQICARTIE